MNFRKNILGAAFVPLLTFNTMKNNDQTLNECATPEEAKVQADELQAIMEETGGDQMEMMEAMMMRGKQLKPYPFEGIQNKAAMFKQHESNDGINLNFDLPLGPQFQLASTYQLSNKNGASFDYTTAVNNADAQSTQETVTNVSIRTESDGKLAVMGSTPLFWKAMCQFQIMFNDKECKDIIQLCNLTRDFKDCGLNYKFQGMQGQGVHSLSFMQSLNRQLQAGWQMSYIAMMGECNFGYCGLYQTLDKSKTLTLSYSPMAQKDSWCTSYIHKFDKKHNFTTFVELKGKLDGMSSEFCGGFRKRFKTGTVTGYMNSAQQMYTSIQKRDQHITAELTTMIDFKNPKHMCKAGVNLTFSMM